MVCGTVSDILRQPYRSGLRDRPTAGQAKLVLRFWWIFLITELSRVGKLREVREVREKLEGS